MRKHIIISLLLSLAAYSIYASAPYSSSHSASDVNASAEVVFNYDREFVRVGFTSEQVKANDFSVKSEISSTVLVKDTVNLNAASGKIWCFWQINNSGSYKISLGSDGIKSSGSTTAFDNWLFDIADRGDDGSSFKFKGLDVRNGNTSTVIKTKNDTASLSGSCSLVISIEDYGQLPSGSYTLPVYLTLESM